MTEVAGQRVEVDEDGRQRLAHYVMPKQVLGDAVVFGLPVTTLCGRVLVPCHDPYRYPRCQVCAQMAYDIWGPAPQD